MIFLAHFVEKLKEMDIEKMEHYLQEFTLSEEGLKRRLMKNYPQMNTKEPINQWVLGCLASLKNSIVQGIPCSLYCSPTSDVMFTGSIRRLIKNHIYMGKPAKESLLDPMVEVAGYEQMGVWEVYGDYEDYRDEIIFGMDKILRDLQRRENYGDFREGAVRIISDHLERSKDLYGYALNLKMD